MTASERHASIRQGIVAQQIIVGGLVFGALLFTAVVGYRFATGAGGLNPDSIMPLTWILLVCAVPTAGLIGMLKFVILSRAHERLGDDEVKLFQAWRTASIVGVAGLEGAAFLCLVGALLDGNPVGLAAGGFCVLLMAFQMPTRPGVDRWIADQMALSTGARSSGRDLRS